jgi:hypothetical protein
MTWPSTFATGTKGYMRDRIDDEIKRSGTLNTRIDACITAAIEIYQKHRFRFNEGVDYSFSTVIDQEYYSAATAQPAGSGGLGAGQVPYAIDYMVIQIGTARFDLVKRSPEEIDLLTQSGTQKGQPHSWSYFNEQIRFYPVPSAVYPIIVSGHEILSGPAADNTTGNRWMTDGERLIRSRAKYELSLNYNVDFPALAQKMHPDNGATFDAFLELTREAAKITGTGRVRPTQF